MNTFESKYCPRCGLNCQSERPFGSTRRVWYCSGINCSVYFDASDSILTEREVQEIIDHYKVQRHLFSKEIEKRGFGSAHN